MTTVTNMLKHRAVKVRDEKGTVVTIPVGESRPVPGFDKSRKFNAAIIERGDIRVGGSIGKRQESDERGVQLKSDLVAAQTAFKQAKDAALEAQKAAKAEDATDADKKAFAVAKESLKAAENAVEDAQAAFNKG